MKNRPDIANPILDGSVTSYLDRLDAEQNNDDKQVLTYVMVTRGEQILAFKRGTYNRVEDSLRGSHCIGFGGHVTVTDRDLFDMDRMGILRCAARELSEELSLPEPDARRLDSLEGLEFRGILNDDSSSLGRRHFAYIFEYRIISSANWDIPKRGEKSITNLRWLSPSRPQNSLWEFEYWSQLCLHEFFPAHASALADFRLRRKRPLRPPHLLCVIGELGSGKSEATRVLRDKLGYTEINSGRILAEILGMPPVPTTPRDEFQDAAWQFINRSDGPRRLASRIAESARSIGSDRVVIDGIRQISTLNCLQQFASPLRVGVLFVHTAPHLAFDFYRSREGNISSQRFTIHDFLRLRDNPVEQEVRGMISMADAVLYNWSGRNQYRDAVRELMTRVNS